MNRGQAGGQQTGLPGGIFLPARPLSCVCSRSLLWVSWAPALSACRLQPSWVGSATAGGAGAGTLFGAWREPRVSTSFWRGQPSRDARITRFPQMNTRRPSAASAKGVFLQGEGGWPTPETNPCIPGQHPQHRPPPVPPIPQGMALLLSAPEPTAAALAMAQAVGSQGYGYRRHCALWRTGYRVPQGWERLWEPEEVSCRLVCLGRG